MISLTVLLPAMMVPASANSGDRTLYLHYTHTKETARFTYKRNGRFDQKVLGELNYFLRDWRRNEPAKMDPALFDLIWAVYNEVGATQPVHIVSAYRSPATNAMLRASSSGVAENSQHTRGQAMDFFIPGVPLPRLREVAMRYQVGGVGYYPNSGSPFVHLDTGNVRAWPRMTRAQLEKIFPDGRTLHLPSDGKVLSEQGRRYAQAEWEKCRMVPCGAAASGGQRTLMAEAPASGRRTLMDLFSGGGQDQSQTTAAARASGSPAPAAPAAPAAIATAPAVPAAPPVPAAPRDIEPETATIAVAALDAPIPMARPAARAPEPTAAAAELPFGTEPSAPLEAPALPAAPRPAIKSAGLMLATAPRPAAAETTETAISAIAALDQAPIPAPRVHMTPRAEPQLVTAYVPQIESEPGARRALEMILSRDTTASIPETKRAPSMPATFTASFPAPAESPAAAVIAEDATIETASLGGAQGALDTIRGLFESTWNAVTGAATASAGMTTALNAVAASRSAEPRLGKRQGDLVAPDLDAGAQSLFSPVPLTDARYAGSYDAEGYVDRDAELGALAGRIDFEPEANAPVYDRFERNTPMILAAR
ncbi:DUF882 domain-containing protein [Arsenicitalea aurantiaca]|uniref:Murein endopeptidase K n=1 Tax=Arsenicitalea aurantiaca TaxID=1783274 RepID=A0A433XKJ5_9HYPH|nr:DUF882 domain-containing protein [Arsenicitalea aurantiaca]RUT34612.1 DUF882 domain-containing protein [Arsenicitalea aurantiaca]